MTDSNTYHKGLPRLSECFDYGANKRGPLDLPFLLLTLLLLGIGVVMVLSASFARAYYDPSDETEGIASYYFTHQLKFALFGIVCLFAASKVKMYAYRYFSFFVLALSVGLLVLVLIFGTGGEEVGATRWLAIGGFSFQPSELAKVGIVLAFSTLICKAGKKMETFRHGVVPFGVILAFIAILLVMEPHYSATIIIFAVGIVLLFVGGIKLSWLILGGVSLSAIGVFVVTKVGYTSDRIAAWLHPLEDTTGKAYQTRQSLFAVGSGGLMGLGLGQSRQKYLYLPEESNDFIFAIVCEELGFIGAALILALFALLIIRGYWLALHSRDRFNFLVIVGFTTLLALQVILNVAVVTNLVPCTGISLPFFSYGGTALVLQLAEMGVILSASREIPAKKSD